MGIAFSQAKQVFWFNLNRKELVEKGIVNLRNIFRDDTSTYPILDFCDAENMLILLDGYDEAKPLLASSELSTINDFCLYLLRIAQKYRIHFVITSKSSAITDFSLKRDDVDVIPLHGLSIDEQEDYCKRQQLTKVYWDTYLKRVCESTMTDDTLHIYVGPFSAEQYIEVRKQNIEKKLNNLLKIPIVFRLVVFRIISIGEDYLNLHGLYNQLINSLYENKRLNEQVRCLYLSLAYDIWCNDEKNTYYEKEPYIDALVLSRYYNNHALGEKNLFSVGFIDNSLYHYFLAQYFYEKMKKCNTVDRMTDFFDCLAERLITGDVLILFKELAKECKDSSMNDIARDILLAFNNMGGIIITQPKIFMGNAEKVIIDRCNNVFVKK